MPKNKKILIFSGGTGGHVIPAINFANYLSDNGYDCSLIVDKRGDKYTKNLKGNKFIIHSSHLTGNVFFKLRALLKLILGFFQSILIIFKFKPKICISFGSYATLAPIFSLLLYKVFFESRLYLHEQNSVIGKVNLLYLKYSEYIFLNFKKIYNLNKKFNDKIVFVGLPSAVKKDKVSFNYIDCSKINVFVYGGSQGAIEIIKKLLIILKELDKNLLDKIKFIIQCPNEITTKIEKKLINQKIDYIIRDYFHNVDEVLSITSLALTRAGAGTINDLIKYNIPAIIFPLKNSINNHQYYNAKYLVENNAAILIDDNNFNTNTCTEIFRELITNSNKLTILKKSLQNISLPNTNELMLKKIFYEKK